MPLCKSWDMEAQDSATTRLDDYIVDMLPWAHGHQRKAIRDFGWCPSIACMAAHTAPTRLWPMVESDAAYFSGCPPCGRARFRLDMAVQSSRYAQRSRMTPSRSGPSQKVMPYEAPARTSRSIWTKSVLSRGNRLSVRHLVYYRSAI